LLSNYSWDKSCAPVTVTSIYKEPVIFTDQLEPMKRLKELASFGENTKRTIWIFIFILFYLYCFDYL